MGSYNPASDSPCSAMDVDENVFDTSESMNEVDCIDDKKSQVRFITSFIYAENFSICLPRRSSTIPKLKDTLTGARLLDTSTFAHFMDTSTVAKLTDTSTVAKLCLGRHALIWM